MLDEKKKLSNLMLEKSVQDKLHKKVKQIISEYTDAKKILEEEDITNQGEIIGALIKEGMWPAPGGAWCSAGVPVFDKMSEGASYPTFKHYKYNGEDVTNLANLDCQTPYYFIFLENGQYNHPVIDYFVEASLKLQNDYNFDGFRLDHVDHVVDDLSAKNGVPISYRIPSKVLGQLNSKMKEKAKKHQLIDDADYYKYNKYPPAMRVDIYLSP